MTQIRKLTANDHQQYRQLLHILSPTTRDCGAESFREFVQKIDGSGNIEIYVLESKDNISNQMIAAATLIIEQKMIHVYGKVGHIEDVVVDPVFQSQQYGRKIIEALVNRAKAAGCYKVILNCNNKNIGFYEKVGFSQSGVEMRIDL